MKPKKKKLKNYGFRPDIPKKEDYQFGSLLSPVPFEELSPTGNWTDYLPITEAQNLYGVESWSCVSFTILNCLETLIFRKYGERRNYSDRFLAAISGTKEGGNTPNVVCEFLRKLGVVPEDLLPFSSDIDTFEKYYAPIPPKLYELAREFNNEWDFKYEAVPDNEEAIEKALKCSPLGISVTAWFRRGEMYYRPEGMAENHFTTLIMAKKRQFKRVFDSYDSYIKDYEWNTKHSVIKRFYISKKTQPKTFWQKISEWLKNMLK